MSFWETVFLVSTPLFLVSIIIGRIYGFHKGLMGLLATLLIIIPAVVAVFEIRYFLILFLFTVPYVLVVILPMSSGVIVGAITKKGIKS